MPHRILPLIPELMSTDPTLRDDGGGSTGSAIIAKPSMLALPVAVTTAAGSCETPRTQLTNMVRRFTPAPGSVATTFNQYRALVPNCVVEKYLDTAKLLPSHTPVGAPRNLQIEDYAESYWGAVLFADISGFSKLAEKLQKELGESAAAAETLSRYVGDSLDIMVKMITSNRGDVIKFAGDAILAVFPAKAFDGNKALATLRCCQVGLKLAKLELVAGPQRLAVHCGLGAGALIGYHVGGVYNRWEYVVTGDPITQIGSAEPEAEAGQLVISAQTIPWLQRGLVQKLPKALRVEITAKLDEQEKRKQQEAFSTEDNNARGGGNKALKRWSSSSSSSSSSSMRGGKRPSSGRTSSLSNLMSFGSAASKDEVDEKDAIIAGLPFDGNILFPSGNFLLLSIDVAMQSLHGKTSASIAFNEAVMEEGDIAAAIEQRRDSTSSLTDTAAIVSSFAAADTPSVDAINITLPVLRHYIPRPVLIALDAGQSIWSSQFFRVTTLFVRLSGLSYASVAYLAELQVCISLQSPPPPLYACFSVRMQFVSPLLSLPLPRI